MATLAGNYYTEQHKYRNFPSLQNILLESSGLEGFQDPFLTSEQINERKEQHSIERKINKGMG